MNDKLNKILRILFEHKNGYPAPNETCFSSKDIELARKLLINLFESSL